MKKLLSLYKAFLANFSRTIHYYKLLLGSYEPRKILQLLRYRTDFFYAVEIETITTCNRRCSYCPNSKYDRGLVENKQLMDENLFKKVIDDLSAMGFKGRLSPHFYGEPLLDKRLPSLLTYAKNKIPALHIHLFTNGDCLTVKNYEKLLQAGVSKITITQHGDEMPRGVKKVFEYRNKNGNGNIDIVYNKSEDLNLYNRGGLVEANPKYQRSKCFNPTEEVIIDYQGNVILCCNDYLGSINFGNLKNNSFAEIWRNESFSRIRRELRKGIFQLNICRECVGLAPEKPQAAVPVKFFPSNLSKTEITNAANSLNSDAG